MTYVRDGRPSTEQSLVRGGRRAHTLARRAAPHIADDLEPEEKVLGAMVLYIGSTFGWMLGGLVVGIVAFNLRAGAGAWSGGDWVVGTLLAVAGGAVGLGLGWWSTRGAPVRSPAGTVTLVVTDRRLLIYNAVRGVRRPPAVVYLLSDIDDVYFRRGTWLRSSTIEFTAGGDRHRYRSTGNLDDSALLEVLGGQTTAQVAHPAPDDHSPS